MLTKNYFCLSASGWNQFLVSTPKSFLPKKIILKSMKNILKVVESISVTT